jgi:hypothetical protein
MMLTWWRISWVVVVAGLLTPVAWADDKIDFNRDIRPILSDNCFACHGPDKAKRKAELRLDTKEGLFGEVDGNYPVVAGKVEKSEVYLRIAAEDEEERMPPKKTGKTLTKQQVELIRKWIEQGAEHKGHWAYVKPERPAAPEAENDPFVRNAIDAFVAVKLKQNGLTPARGAEKVTLVRRLYFDLLGLPPTPEEVKAFVEDKSAGAYDVLVDRLLASPHFGERMAQHWLDWVRFGDTNGIHSDNPVNIWPYRDYVINAFNANKRFDQFTIEQVAGDLMENATLEQRIASGYNRLLITTEEGGAQPKEYTAKYGADRVRNVSAVWLGQTMGCAECHDHKFDPITAKDFYGMQAFFADVQEAAVGKREPGMPVPSPEQKKHLKAFDEQIAALKEKLNSNPPELAAAQAEWERAQRNGVDEWKTLEPSDAKVQGESKLKIEEGGVLRSVYKLAANETFVITVKTDAKELTGFRLEALDDDAYPERGPGGSPNGNFVLTEFKVAAVGKDVKSKPVKLRNARADHSQDNFGVANAIDGKDDTGWAILPHVGKPHVAMFEAEKAVGAEGETTTVVFTLEFKSRYPQHQIGKMRFSATTVPNPASRWLPGNVAKIVAIAAEQRDEKQSQELAAFYRSIAPMLQPIRDELAAVQRQKDELEKSLPTTLVTTAMATPRTVRILPRGNWLDDSGPVVDPAIPGFLGALDVTGRRANRMDLAKWLASRENPLTARVMMNRFWRMYFGHGISKSQEDFGAQGEWPTNPDLLDWLAAEFMESGWDVKHMVRLIVTSNAYRRTSRPTKEQKEKDPENRLYARQSRFRHDAEVVRDNVLAVTGLLVNRIGGPSVKPYQPAGYWDYLNFPKRTWEHDKGDPLYRRGLYVWWQRTFLHPSLVAFDAPTREECTAERARSNIPQQALVLLNDPSYVEAARVFAECILRNGADTRRRLDFAFERALSRKPREDEAAVLVALLEKHQAQYRQDQKAAEELISVGEWPVPRDIDATELAAWTSVARAVLNTHEMVTRN